MSASFPFELLHSEMVLYAKQRNEEREKARAKLRESSSLDENLLTLAFSQHSALSSLESLGWRVGYVLAEKISRESPRLAAELDIMKFICKEFWVSCFGKQVDNLRTNHQGVYVVHDNNFATVSTLASGDENIKESGVFLAYPTGLLRGALSALNINALVTTTVETLPAIKFHIQIQQKASK